VASTVDFQEMFLQPHRDRVNYSGSTRKTSKIFEGFDIVTQVLIGKTFFSNSSIGLTYTVINVK